VTIKLRDDWLAKIKPALVDGLKQVTVKNGMFIDRSASLALAVADFHLPKNSPVRRQLEEFVDEYPLLEFVTDTLSRELRDLDKYLADVKSAPLTDVEGYEDAEAVATRLLAEIQTLPWDYLISLKLPRTLWAYAPDKDFQVCDDIWLRRGGDALEALSPLENLPDALAKRVRGQGLLGLMIGTGPEWEPGAVYVQMRVRGFVPPYGDSESFRVAISRLKALFGLWIAIRVVDLKSRNLGSAPKEYLIIHRNHPDGFKVDNRLELADDFCAVLARMEAFDNSGKIKDEEVKKSWFLQDLQKISDVFKNEVDTSNLLLAGQWVFDSHTDSDTLLTYIRSMVVLEILLGSQRDGSEMSIGELIRNRCAYLIGKDFKQRQRIMDDLKKIYAVRSQIVHRGKARLTLSERTMLSRLQWMGNRVIQEEIARVPKEEKAPAS